MVIDDNVDLLETLRNVLTKKGYAVAAFQNNDEAIGYFTMYSNEISLVCQDIIRPRGECLKHLDTNTNKIGIIFLRECLRRIKPEIPCLFQTSYALENLPELESLHNTYYIRKPYELDELVAAIENVISKARVIAEEEATNVKGIGETVLETNTPLRVVSIILLLVGIGNLPHAYYVILRAYIFAVSFISMVHFSWYEENKTHKKLWMTIFAITALVFNPVIPFFFEKEVWSAIDVVVAVAFLASIVRLR